MAEQPLDAAIAALRYALACLDEMERQVSGAQPSAAGFTMPLDAMPALADLAIAARCALAEQLGVTDPAAQRHVTRQLFVSELETHTIAAQEAGLSEAVSAARPQPEQLLAPGGGQDSDLDPEFGAALWAFVAAVRTGKAKRSRRDPEFASYLAGLWEMAMAGVYAAGGGISLDEGRAKVAELVEAQRAIYGSLAAGDR
jgi:hypothetical protein